MKYGARNQLTGKITMIKKGDVMCQVRLEVDPGAVMNSVMTMESLGDQGRRFGQNYREGDQRLIGHGIAAPCRTASTRRCKKWLTGVLNSEIINEAVSID